MAHFLISAGEEIQKHFREKEVNQTNTTFKLFSKVTFALCIFASILVGGTQYFGKPMNCDLGTAPVVNQDLLNDYCWIHGTTHIPKNSKRTFGCNFKEGSGQTKHVYYQWVVFMLVINALLFKIPHLIWKYCEGGLMKEFFSGKGLKARFLSENTVNENLVIDLGYYMKLKGEHNTYFFIFQACQLLNIVMLGLNWWITNIFLGENFTSYGSDVIKYYSELPENSYVESERSDKVDPMCNAFPTQVNCPVTTGSTSGQPTTVNAICVLSQNIINEKIYLFLWFWFVLMFVVSAIQLIFEIAILTVPSFRSFVIARQTGSYLSGDVKNFIEQECNHGDWFVLHQIAKNTNRDFYSRFLEKLEKTYRNRNGERQELLKENQPSPGNVTIPMENVMSKGYTAENTV